MYNTWGGLWSRDVDLPEITTAIEYACIYARQSLSYVDGLKCAFSKCISTYIRHAVRQIDISDAASHKRLDVYKLHAFGYNYLLQAYAVFESLRKYPGESIRKINLLKARHPRNILHPKRLRVSGRTTFSNA